MILSQGDDIKNWQDGLRALLPNINISFSGTVLNNKGNAIFKFVIDGVEWLSLVCQLSIR